MAATMIKAHKIRLNPTPEQEDYRRRAAGTRRFVYTNVLICQEASAFLDASWIDGHTKPSL